MTQVTIVAGFHYCSELPWNVDKAWVGSNRYGQKIVIARCCSLNVGMPQEKAVNVFPHTKLF